MLRLSDYNYSGVLAGALYLSAYPMHKMRRVDRPTTQVTDNIMRVDEREGGFNRARRGDFGTLTHKEVFRFVQKHPISSAENDLATHLGPIVEGNNAT